MVIQISNDSWFGKWYGPHQHLANSLIRSVEFQKPLIRSTPSGITSVVDYSGKIIETIPTNKKGYLYYQHPINKYKSNCSSTLFSVTAGSSFFILSPKFTFSATVNHSNKAPC